MTYIKLTMQLIKNAGEFFSLLKLPQCLLWVDLARYYQASANDC